MFMVKRGGCNAMHPSPYLMDRKSGLNHYLLLLVKSSALFQVNNITYSVTPHSAIIIAPGTPYSYQNPDGYYINDWLHFDCDNPQIFQMPKIPLNQPFLVGTPATITIYLQQILWENHYTPSPHKESNIDMLMHILLNHLHLSTKEQAQIEHYSPYRTKLQNLRLTMLTKPFESYSCQEKATELGISVSYFQHLYKALFRVAFQTDLIMMRCEYAKQLLASTNLTIEQVALQSGYATPIHFYRQFKQQTGITPSSYRKTQKNDEIVGPPR